MSDDDFDDEYLEYLIFTGADRMPYKRKESCLGCFFRCLFWGFCIFIWFGFLFDFDTSTEPKKSDVASVSTESSTGYYEVEGYTIKEVKGLLYVNKETNVRRLPAVSGEKVGTVPAGQYIAVCGVCEETGWYKIMYEGEFMYVSYLYMSEVEMSE